MFQVKKSFLPLEIPQIVNEEIKIIFQIKKIVIYIHDAKNYRGICSYGTHKILETFFIAKLKPSLNKCYFCSKTV